MTARQDGDQIHASDDLSRREADQAAKAARDRAAIRLVIDLVATALSVGSEQGYCQG